MRAIKTRTPGSGSKEHNQSRPKSPENAIVIKLDLKTLEKEKQRETVSLR